jgi:hypothetical protein
VTDRQEIGGALPSVVAVGCDLDRTLIYSASALALGPCPDRLRVVEWREGRPESFVTERAAELLAELDRVAVLVPATTRSWEQYRRIRLPLAAPPRFAVCTNGGRLLVDGEPDPEWDAAVRRRLAEGTAPLTEVLEQLRRVADPGWVLKRKVAEELFAYLVVDLAALPHEWEQELAAWAEPRGWRLSRQGRKLYLTPEPLTKSAAVAEAARRTGARTVLAAGDALLDAELLLAADAGWRPGHGELAEHGWTAPGVTALTTRGGTAAEEILTAMLDRVDGKAPTPVAASASDALDAPDGERSGVSQPSF